MVALSSMWAMAIRNRRKGRNWKSFFFIFLFICAPAKPKRLQGRLRVFDCASLSHYLDLNSANLFWLCHFYWVILHLEISFPLFWLLSKCVTVILQVAQVKCVCGTDPSGSWLIARALQTRNKPSPIGGKFGPLAQAKTTPIGDEAL